MLNDIEFMKDDEIYAARYDLAGAIVNAKGLIIHLSKDKETRDMGCALRDLCDLAESRLLAVTRPR
jgi:proteasome assembly chaperone (PAC2) family protein